VGAASERESETEWHSKSGLPQRMFSLSDAVSIAGLEIMIRRSLKACSRLVPDEVGCNPGDLCFPRNISEDRFGKYEFLHDD
jgi:hypothetical protein